MNRKTMSKYLNLQLIAFVLSVSTLILVSCGGGGGSSDSNADNNTVSVQMPGKGLDINLNSDDDLIVSATDNNDLLYSFFGAFDDNGELQYIKQLILYQLDSNPEDAYHYLTIDFDNFQRPISVILPDLGIEIAVNYLSEETVEVTVTDIEGLTESIEVVNPFPAIQENKGYINSVQPYALEPGLETKSTFIGYVDICEGEKRKPNIWINRKHAVSPSHPGVLIIPRIEEFADPDGYAEYTYTYSFNVPNADFNTWRNTCQKLKVDSGIKMIGSAVGGPLIKILTAIESLVGATLKDAESQTTNDTTKEYIAFALDRVGDRYAGGVSIGAFIKEVGEYLENKGYGPCSLETWKYKRTLEFADQTVYCRLGDDNNYETKEQKFTPDNYDEFQEAPEFRFVCDKADRKVWRMFKKKIIDDEYESTRTTCIGKGEEGEIVSLNNNSIVTQWYRRVKGCSNHYDLQGSINFDAPPTEADPGEQVTLNLNGSLSGYQDCCFLILSFNYYPKAGSISPTTSLELNLRILQQTMVTIPEEGSSHLGWQGTIPGQVAYKYTFPEVDDGVTEFYISGRGNRGIGYSWHYQLQDYN